MVDPRNLNLDSFDDPFNRVIDIDTDHPTNLQDPIIVHANGTTIIDGFHRAYQAQQQGLDKIPAWVPVQQGMAEGKITLSTDPNWYGATVDDYKATGPVVDIPADKLVGFEPDDKMNQPKSKANVRKIVAGLKRGHKLPPLLVRKYKNGYQVLDGHHRFKAYKLLGVQLIPAQIVPARDIEEKGKQGVAEGGSGSMAKKDYSLGLQELGKNYNQAWKNNPWKAELVDRPSFLDFEVQLTNPDRKSTRLNSSH